VKTTAHPPENYNLRIGSERGKKRGEGLEGHPSRSDFSCQRVEIDWRSVVCGEASREGGREVDRQTKEIDPFLKEKELFP